MKVGGGRPVPARAKLAIDDKTKTMMNLMALSKAWENANVYEMRVIKSDLVSVYKLS